MTTRKFTYLINNKEIGTYKGRSPSSVARKVVSRLCMNKEKIEFYLREKTKNSNKKIYGPYEGFLEKLDKPIELKGRIIRNKPIVHKMIGGDLLGREISMKIDFDDGTSMTIIKKRKSIWKTSKFSSFLPGVNKGESLYTAIIGNKQLGPTSSKILSNSLISEKDFLGDSKNNYEKIRKFLEKLDSFDKQESKNYWYNFSISFREAMTNAKIFVKPNNKNEIRNYYLDIYQRKLGNNLYSIKQTGNNRNIIRFSLEKFPDNSFQIKLNGKYIGGQFGRRYRLEELDDFLEMMDFYEISNNNRDKLSQFIKEKITNKDNKSE